MSVIHDILRLLSFPSYVAPIPFLYILFHYIRAKKKHHTYTLQDARAELHGLTNNDGSRTMFAAFLIIILATITVYPTTIDLLDIQDIRFVPRGTYSYNVQCYNGAVYPAEIRIDYNNGRKYYISSMYKGDSVIYFVDDSDFNEILLKKYSFCSTEDFDDSEYLILLNQHIEDSRIKETSYITVPHILFFAVIITADMFLFIIFFPKKKFEIEDYIDKKIKELSQ